MTQLPPPSDEDRGARSGVDTTVNLTTPEALEDTQIRAGLTEQEIALVRALPRGSALLLVPRGPGAGSRFLLDTDVTSVGRDENADIFLDDVTVSRKHVELVRELDDFRVRDVGSLNGTYVNRERIDDVLLRNGDELQVGKYRLVYCTRAEDDAPAGEGSTNAPQQGEAPKPETEQR